MSTAAYLSMIRTAMTAAGGTWPKSVANALADAEELPAAVAAIPGPSVDDLAGAVVDCLTAGRDPLDDEHVRRLTTAAVLAGPTGNALRGGVTRAAEARVVGALTESADDVLATLCEAVAESGATLSAAWRILGDLELNDAGAVLKMGPDASRAWTDAIAAQKRIRAIDGGWFGLAELTRFAGSSTSAPTLRLADLSLEQYEKLGRKAEPWDIVRAGATIELADRTTIRERVARHTGEREARQTNHAESIRTAYRRTHGVTVA
jgi:hypothetical protein